MEHSVLIGTLLGDGHIQKVQSKTNKCRLRISHSEKQQEYILWKHNTLVNYGPSEISLDSKNQLRFYTQYSLEMLEYHQLFYNEIALGKYRKLITETIELDEVALAVWYMDDGTKRLDCNQCRFATNGFSLEEIKVLQIKLMINFGLPANIVRSGRSKIGKHQWYTLCISAKYFQDFYNVIGLFIKQEVPSMYYKIKPRND